MASSEAIDVLSSQFQALRAEIAARSQAQANALQLTVTALGVLGGLAFSTAGDKRMLLLIPVVAAILGLIWLDHAANIFNLGDFIKDRLIPSLKTAAAMDELPDYEAFIRVYERRRHVILRAFGLPPFLVFVLLPVIAMVISFDAPCHDWVFWTLFWIDAALLGVFVLYWAPYLSGPRPARGAADETSAPRS